jgi:hypothetical protein
LDGQTSDAAPVSRREVAASEVYPGPRGRSGRRSLGFGALLVLAAGLAIGVQQHYRQHLDVAAAAEEQRDFVPRVRVARVRATPGIRKVVLPATTTAFEAANIFARASGYIVLRNVDIGSRVKAGDLLALISPPELEHQSPGRRRPWRRTRQPCARRKPIASSPRTTGRATTRWSSKARSHGSRATPTA